MGTTPEHRHQASVPLGGVVAASSSSPVAFGVISVAVSAGVFAGPLIETRRRAKSVRVATTAACGPEASSGYRTLVEAEQRRVFRIAALMTGRPDRATAIVEEAFAHTLQRWTRSSAEERVRYLLSSVVKRCIGDAFVGFFSDAVSGEAGVGEPDERLRRAARALSALQPTRRAVVILSESERFSPEEIAALTGLPRERVVAELAQGLEDLGPVLTVVAA